MWVAFALQKLLTFFSKKFQHICVSLDLNFNESLTNDIVSFEQLGLDHKKLAVVSQNGQNMSLLRSWFSYPWWMESWILSRQ